MDLIKLNALKQNIEQHLNQMDVKISDTHDGVILLENSYKGLRKELSGYRSFVVNNIEDHEKRISSLEKKMKER